jgi:hypothetical protein
MDSKIYIETVRVFFDMLPGDPVGLPDDSFSFVFVLNVCGIDEEELRRTKRQGVRDKTMLRSFFAGLGDEGDADYADYADYAELEMCWDCSMQNLDAFGVEDFIWKVLVDGEGGKFYKIGNMGSVNSINSAIAIIPGSFWIARCFLILGVRI